MRGKQFPDWRIDTMAYSYYVVYYTITYVIFSKTKIIDFSGKY